MKSLRWNEARLQFAPPHEGGTPRQLDRSRTSPWKTRMLRVVVRRAAAPSKTRGKCGRDETSVNTGSTIDLETPIESC